MKTNSLAFRLAVGALIWITGALTVSGFSLSKIFDDHLERNLDRRARVVLESLYKQAEFRDGGLVLEGVHSEPRFDRRPFSESGWYFQIIGPDGAILQKSYSLFLQTLELPPTPPTSLRRHEIAGPANQRLLVLEQAVYFESEKPYRFAVGADLAQVEREAAPFNRVLSWSLGILWFGLLVASVVQIYFGLRPLGRIRAGLSDIRNGRAERLEGDFPAEVTPLAEELNAHLGHISAIVERARTHVGNLAHSLKTPISVLKNDATSASGPLADTVRRQTEIMSRRVDHYLVRARTAAMGDVLGARTSVRPVLDDLSRTLMRIHADRRIDVSFDTTGPMDFRGDRQDLEEMVGNLMDNACKWARAEVRVSAEAVGGRLRFIVDDDGPGLPLKEREEALRRGGRLDESVPGTGLGLSIVEEIAGLYGGHLSLAESPSSGLRAVLELPRAESVGA